VHTKSRSVISALAGVHDRGFGVASLARIQMPAQVFSFFHPRPRLSLRPATASPPPGAVPVHKYSSVRPVVKHEYQDGETWYPCFTITESMPHFLQPTLVLDRHPCLAQATTPVLRCYLVVPAAASAAGPPADPTPPTTSCPSAQAPPGIKVCQVV
jgi:hypothetical protein